MRRYSLRLLSALWITYGVCHFVFSAETLRQVPPYFPAKEFLVSATGVLEIVLGSALLYSRTRRSAAQGLLLLLVAYVPAVVYMFVHDVLPTTWPSTLRTITWAWIFPHHALLAWWVWSFARSDVRPRTRDRMLTR